MSGLVFHLFVAVVGFGLELELLQVVVAVRVGKEASSDAVLNRDGNTIWPFFVLNLFVNTFQNATHLVICDDSVAPKGDDRPVEGVEEREAPGVTLVIRDGDQSERITRFHIIVGGLLPICWMAG